MTQVQALRTMHVVAPRIGERLFLTAGTAVTLAYSLLGTGAVADALFVVTSVAAAIVLWLGISRHRPTVRSAWFLVGTAVAILAGGNALAALARLPGLEGLRGVADLLFMIAYAPLFAAASKFGRGALLADRTVLLDTAIVAIAAIPFVWEIVVEPYLPATRNAPEALVALAIPVVDIVLLSLVTPLAYVRSLRSPSSVLLVGGLAAMGLGDSMYALGTLQPSTSASVATNVGWLMSYVLLGAAALVPSSVALGVARDPDPGAGDRSRIIVVAAAVLASPLLMLHEVIEGADIELVALAGLALVAAGLLILRLQRTIGQLATADLHFRRFMRHNGIVAVIKDGAGRYLYMNPTAETERGLLRNSWYGRTDAELFGPDVSDLGQTADAAVRDQGSVVTEISGHGEQTWLEERFPIPGTHGEVGLIGIDITERVRAERAVQFQARLLESVLDAVIVVDMEGRVTYWNRGAEEILGYEAAEMHGQTMGHLLPTDSVDELAGYWEEMQRGKVLELDWLARHRNRSDVWLNARVGPLLDDAGQITGFLTVAKDVTARKVAELELARLGTAIDNATDGILVTDEEDRVVYTNPAFERITGIHALDLRGELAVDVPNAAALGRALAHARHVDGGWRGDVVARRRDGSDLVCATTISAVATGLAAAPGFVTIIRDVTAERASERAADRRARERALVAETLSSLRTGQAPEATALAVCAQIVKLPELAVASVITFGLDGVATVLGQVFQEGVGRPGLPLSNDRSSYLRDRAVAGPWVDRWVHDASHPYAELFEEYGILANAYAPMMVDGRPIGLLVTGSDRIDAIDRLTERLPALLEFSAIATTLLRGEVADRNATAAELAEIRRIIDARAFATVFQPIVDIASGAVRGFEALTRFDDGTRPDLRFEDAHRLGAGLELEAASLRAAFEAANGLPAGTWLNVNVSPEAILAGVAGGVLPAGDREVLLEITEHQAITDYVTFRDAMAPLRDRVRLAIDDAGAGFASLRHIVELAPSMVKMDRSLVTGIDEDVARQAVVAGMVRFANAAGLTLLAEGVETEGELASLRGLGVQLGQGYLLGRPGPLGAVLANIPNPVADDQGRE